MLEDEEHFFNITDKLHPSNSTFLFPQADLTSETFKSFNEVIAQLERQQLKEELQIRNLYRKRMSNDYLYLKCRFCKSILSMKIRGEKVVFVRFDNVHNHSNRKSKKYEENAILIYLNELLQTNTMDQARLLLKNRFQMTNNRLNYIWSKWAKHSNFNIALSMLESKRYLMRSFKGKELDIPELFIAIPQESFELFKKWGEVISFDITYNLIKNRSTDNKQWGVGFFCGMASNLQIIIFGFTLICNQSKESFARLFLNFFEMFGNSNIVIITDQQASIKEALKQLKQRGLFQGQHFFDIFHVLKNIRKKTHKQNFQYYKNMVKSRNRQQYELALKDLLQNQSNSSIIRKFDQESQRYCFSQLPSVFTGFSSSSSRNQKFNDMIKKRIPRESNIVVLVRQINRLLQVVNAKSFTPKNQTKKYEVLFGDFHIKEVREQVSKKIFQKFLLCYVKGLRMQAEKSNENKFIIGNTKTKHLVWFEQRWNCQCKYFQKSGIPCQHLIKILWLNREYKYINYIIKRWKLQRLSETEKRGRPRNSRKNMIP